MNEELKSHDSEELLEDGINLRLFSKSKQLKNNTSGIKGVHYNKQLKKYQAYITINKKRTNLGVYKTLEEAKLARINAESKYREVLQISK